jgi:hypothetical protein
MLENRPGIDGTLQYLDGVLGISRKRDPLEVPSMVIAPVSIPMIDHGFQRIVIRDKSQGHEAMDLETSGSPMRGQSDRGIFRLVMMLENKAFWVPYPAEVGYLVLIAFQRHRKPELFRRHYWRYSIGSPRNHFNILFDGVKYPSSIFQDK